MFHLACLTGKMHGESKAAYFAHLDSVCIVNVNVTDELLFLCKHVSIILKAFVCVCVGGCVHVYVCACMHACMPA